MDRQEDAREDSSRNNSSSICTSSLDHSCCLCSPFRDKVLVTPAMNNAILLEQYPFPPVIDNTMREDWLRCPHNFFRRHVQGLRLVQLGAPGELAEVPKSIHLHFGGALARGLEVTRRAWVADGVSEQQALQAGAEALMRAWGDDIMPEPVTQSERNKTLQSCLLAHAGYFREWPLDDPMQQVAVREGEPLVESNGALPIPGCYHPVTGEPLLYAGRFDAILNRGKHWGLDDKTTGSSVDSEGWRKQWQLNGQFTGYTWLAREWGYGLDGFLVHGIQILKASLKFAEIVAPRPKWQVEQWLRQLQTDVQTMCLSYSQFINSTWDETLDAHPYSQVLGHACVAFNKPCAYLDDLCGQPNPDDWLHRFTVQRWDPLHRSVEE